MKYYAIYDLSDDNKSTIINILPSYDAVKLFCDVFKDKDNLYVYEFETEQRIGDLESIISELEDTIDSKGEFKKYE